MIGPRRHNNAHQSRIKHPDSNALGMAARNLVPCCYKVVTLSLIRVCFDLRNSTILKPATFKIMVSGLTQRLSADTGA